MDGTSLHYLNSYIPESKRMDGFELMYATYNDGWSLHHLYEITEHLAPCVIVCRAAESLAVFGIYVSQAISPPREAIRGDGNCFCFRLDGAKSAKYNWTSPNENSPLTVIATTNQFAICTNTYMAFGGSILHSSNAIRIDNDLQKASTGDSDTYKNPNLVPEEKHHFWLGDVEVFCGRSSVRKSGRPTSAVNTE